MEYGEIYYPLITAFNEDIKNNREPSHITELMIISIKSLLPSETLEKVYIDYERYRKEVEFWRIYKSGDNPVLANLFDQLDSNIYLNGIDNTVYTRILPIIMVNKDFSNIKDEVIKNILFTSGRIETLIEGILLSKLIFLLMEKKEDIVEDLKEEIIGFSQEDFLNTYGGYYHPPKLAKNKFFKISFEQNKIEALNLLNSSKTKGLDTLRDALGVYQDGKEPNTGIGKCIRAIMAEKAEEEFVTNYHKSLIEYLDRLRKGRISPDLLKIEDYYLPDVFQFNKGEEFFHSLLNNCRVIDRENKEDRLIISLRTKSGIYKCRQ